MFANSFYFDHFDDVLQNVIILAVFVSKMKGNSITNFTECHLDRVLTIKIQNKLWIFFQNLVPLHRQLAENTQ